MSVKKMFIILFILVSSCCPKENTTWIITKNDGRKDTIQARDYWFLTQDTLFIGFETLDGVRILYSRSGVESIERKTRD